MKNKVLLVLVFLCFPMIPPASTELEKYPPARRIEQAERWNGVEIRDPYRWMEDSNSDETKRWIQSQDQLFARFINRASDQKNIQPRLASLWNFDLYSAPIKTKEIYFFTKTPAGESSAILYKHRFPAAPVSVLQPEDVGKDRSIAGFYPSPEGRWVACTIRKGQSRWLEMKIVNQEGQFQTDSLLGLHTLGGAIAWSQDSSGFYYVRFEQPQAAEENQAIIKNPAIYYHRLGTDQSLDRRIYSRTDGSNWSFTIQTSDDGRYLVITASEGGSSKNSILYRDLSFPATDFTELISADATYTYLGNRENEFFVYTNLQAPNGRIVSVDLKDSDRKHWKTLIAESTEAIAGGSLVGGNAVGYFGNRFVVLYWSDALPLLKVFNEQGVLQKSVELPEGSSIWGGISGNSRDPEVFYAVLTLTRPRTIYKLNVTSGRSEIFQSVNNDFPSEQFVTKHVFYRSKDGTKVPMFIVHRKGISLNGKHPLFLYGYGAFGWNSFLWYQPNVLVWLEQGGIYALPRIRGGGEYGESWHQSGIKQNKKNTIEDYIAAAEWLMQNGYTSPDRLVANGGSASGFLAAIAVMKRPDLFGAALIDIPFLDLLRYHKYTGGQQFAPEFGSVDDPDEFEFLRSISPYHNVKSQCYPPMLIQVGELDQTAVPMHGYKYVAAMQSAQKCDNPILLHLMRGAGHNFGATPEQSIQISADALHFLFQALPPKH